MAWILAQNPTPGNVDRSWESDAIKIADSEVDRRRGWERARFQSNSRLQDGPRSKAIVTIALSCLRDIWSTVVYIDITVPTAYHVRRPASRWAMRKLNFTYCNEEYTCLTPRIGRDHASL